MTSTGSQLPSKAYNVSEVATTGMLWCFTYTTGH